MSRISPVLGTLGYALLLGGCTTLNVDTAEGVGGRRTYIGVVVVQAPVDADNATAVPRVRHTDVSTWGLRLDRGASLGYLNERLLSLPLDCRIVIFVRSTPELAQAASLLRSISQEQPCIATTP